MEFLTNDIAAIVVLIIYLLLSAVALVSHIFNLPGNFIILGFSLLFAWYDGFQQITVKIIIVLAVIAILAEITDFVIGIAGAKKYKSSSRAIIFSIIFGVIGGILLSPLFFGFGALLGALSGAYIGALIVELLSGKNMQESLKSAWGVFLGKLGGVFSKVAMGLIMIFITVKSFF
ncbi:MAG: DUF456 family protein [Thermodesulfobacteriota bacterium]